MFGWDFEVDAWSRFWRWGLIKICVWTLVSWTQPSGPLCLWQCFDHTAKLRMDGGRRYISKECPRFPDCKVFDAAAFFACYSQSSFSFPPPSRLQLITASTKDITGQSSNLPAFPASLSPLPATNHRFCWKAATLQKEAQSQRWLWMFELKEPKVP